MVVKKISELDLLALAAADDELVVVDKSDTTEAPSGTTKRLVGSGFSGLIVHGGLQSLGEDDHPQYLNAARHDTTDHSTALGNAALNDLGDVDLAGISTGAIMYWTGDTWVDVAPGTLGQILEANGAGVPGFTDRLKLIDDDSFIGGGASTTTEFTVFTLTIPTGLPAAGSLFQFEAWGGVRRDINGLHLRLKFNDVTQLQTGVGTSIPGNGSVECPWSMNGRIYFPSAASQNLLLTGHFAGNPSSESFAALAAVGDMRQGRASDNVDTAAGDLVVTLTAQYQSSDADHLMSTDRALLAQVLS